MHPIFFAYGHRIRSHNLVEPFDTVDLYFLFCEILGLDAPGYLKGNRENILGILKEDETKRLSRWMVLSEFTRILFYFKRILYFPNIHMTQFY